MSKKSAGVTLSKSEQQERVRRTVYKILPVISILLLLTLWVVASGNDSTSFPSPMAVYDRFWKFMEKPIQKLSLWQHILASLGRVLVALIASWVLGISFGILIGWNNKANALLGPIFTAFRVVPPLAWIPLITIWFGTGEFPKILVVFIGAVMPVVVNTQAGMSNVDQQYLDVGRIFNADKWQMLLDFAIPSALDAIFAGVRTSASAAWMVVLAAEMLGGKSGVGFLITRGMDSGDLPLVLLSMICIGIIGAILAIAMQLIERWVCPWTVRKSS